MGTWITGAIVLAVVGLAVRKIYMDKKSGSGCGGGCSGCTQCPGHQHNSTTTD